MQEVLQRCSFENTKSTKGASKLRRDLINAEISQLRDLLPLPPSTRQRLSQLQLMALVCVYVRKSNYFQQVLKHREEANIPNLGFSKALNGFLMIITQGGKLLYISDNAAEYLGHSMEDLLIHGDSVFDIIDKQDHTAVQSELVRASQNQNPHEEDRLFLCRMNVSRNARRQMRFGDQKVILVEGRYLSYLPLCSRNEPVFVAHCTPVAMPETRESVVQGATNVFTSIHSLDMKFLNLDQNGEFYLGYSKTALSGVSWYHLIHPDNLRDAQTKHKLITTNEQEKSCILLLRLQSSSGNWQWIHCVLQVKDQTDAVPSQSGTQPSSSQQQSVIVATNQVLSTRDATLLKANPWLYHYYAVHSKLQYGGIPYESTIQHIHPYYSTVMSYQTDSNGAYMTPSALNGSHYQFASQSSTSNTSAYTFPSPATSFSHFHHYHPHYQMRLQHSLEHSQESPWSTSHEVSHATQFKPTLKSNSKSSTPSSSPRESPPGISSSSEGGIAVAAPIAVRATLMAPPKMHTELEDSDTSSWKSSPTQEVPDYLEHPYFVSTPYPSTPTKHSLFSFESAEGKDYISRDQRVPSVESSDIAWQYDPHHLRRGPWFPTQEDLPNSLRPVQQT